MTSPYSKIKAALNYYSTPEADRLIKKLELDKALSLLEAELSGVNLDHVKRVFELYEVDKANLEQNLKYAKEVEAKSVHDLGDATKVSSEKTTASIFYQGLLDKLTSQYLDSLSELLSSVYFSVYRDLNKRVVLTMEDYRKKKVIRLNIINNVDGHDYKEDISEDGGSASIVLGLVVAIYFIMTTGLPRIIFLDESFSALHNKALEGLMPFLDTFVKEMGFVFVAVAHDFYRYKDYITKIYHVENGEYFLVDSIDDYIEDNFNKKKKELIQ